MNDESLLTEMLVVGIWYAVTTFTLLHTVWRLHLTLTRWIRTIHVVGAVCNRVWATTLHKIYNTCSTEIHDSSRLYTGLMQIVQQDIFSLFTKRFQCPISGFVNKWPFSGSKHKMKASKFLKCLKLANTEFCITLPQLQLFEKNVLLENKIFKPLTLN